MYSDYLYKNDCRSAKTQEREEVRLEYPGMTDRHRPIQHHVYSDLRAGRCVLRDRIHFSAINPKPFQELHAGLVAAAFSALGLTALCTSAMQNLATLMVLEDLRLPALRAPQHLESH